ncbi:hypothetical protein EBZ39_11865 [bacterium]|nr:hypothetical protein [bacterium]
MKKKTPTPNKSMEIRKAARELVAQGKPPRPQVSTALRDTEFALRKPDWHNPPVILPDPAQALGQVSIEDVLKARKFVDEMGTLEKAAASIVALGQFGYTPTAPQTPQIEENKDITQNRTFIAETQAAEQHRDQIHS